MTLTRSALVAGLSLALLGAGDAAAGQLRPLFPLFQRRGCQIGTRPLSFGNYDTIAGTSVDAVGQVVYICGRVESGDQRLLRDIRIDISRGTSNSYDRSMTSGNEKLRYNVYLDAAHTTVWGDGSSNTDYYLDRRPPNDTEVHVPLYGRIFALQDVSVGPYFDLLQVTIQF